MFTICWTKLKVAVIIAWDAMICANVSTDTAWRIVNITYRRKNGENEDNPIIEIDLMISVCRDLSKLTSKALRL